MRMALVLREHTYKYLWSKGTVPVTFFQMVKKKYKNTGRQKIDKLHVENVNNWEAWVKDIREFVAKLL